MQGTNLTETHQVFEQLGGEEIEFVSEHFALRDHRRLFAEGREDGLCLGELLRVLGDVAETADHL